MKKIILVDEIQLGSFLFQGYIVEHGDEMISYSIFVEKFEQPFISMIANPNKEVCFSFNEDIIDFIDKNKTKDKNIRKTIFKTFYQFVIDSEKKASYMVFKKEKLNYFKKSKEIIAMKDRYIND